MLSSALHTEPKSSEVWIPARPDLSIWAFLCSRLWLRLWSRLELLPGIFCMRQKEEKNICISWKNRRKDVGSNFLTSSPFFIFFFFFFWTKASFLFLLLSLPLRLKRPSRLPFLWWWVSLKEFPSRTWWESSTSLWDKTRLVSWDPTAQVKKKEDELFLFSHFDWLFFSLFCRSD